MTHARTSSCVLSALFLAFFLVVRVSTYLCTDVNVYCVCAACGYTTIDSAYLACSANRTDCRIMISSDLGAYDEHVLVDISMGELTPGEFVPFPDEIVMWRSIHGPTLNISANFWSVKSNAGGEIHMTSYEDSVIVLAKNAVGISIGPGVELEAPDEGSGVLVSSLRPDGIVIDGVIFRGCYGVRVLSDDYYTSSLFEHRITLQNCQFLDTRTPISFKRLQDIVILNSYFRPVIGSRSLHFRGVKNVIIRNNVFEVGAGEETLDCILLETDPGSFQNRNFSIDHNTFSCLVSTVPMNGVISFGCMWTAFDPQLIAVVNNLFGGECSSMAAGDSVVQEDGACMPGCGLDDSSSYAYCNRWEFGDFLNNPNSWSYDDCGMGGAHPVFFERMGEKPSPYFDPVVSYEFGNITDVTEDMMGRPRSGGELGALVVSNQHACFEPNVYCVCDSPLLCVDTAIYGAFWKCAVQDARDDCVIMISGGTYFESLHINVSMNSATPGRFMPFPNEFVTISSLTTPVVITANYWWFGAESHDDFLSGGWISLTTTGANSVVLVEGSPLYGVHVGPMEIGGAGGIPEAILLVNSSGMEGILIDGVKTNPSSNPPTSISIVGSSPGWPSLFPYRVVVRRCELVEDVNSAQLKIGPGIDAFVIEGNMINARNTHVAISVEGQHGMIQNNFLVTDNTAPPCVVRLQNTGSGVFNVTLRHNTFSCLMITPAISVIQLMGLPSLTTDPDEIQVLSNLFLGFCGPVDIVTESNCHGSKCLNGDGLVGCNRQEDSALVVPATSTWDNVSVWCPDSGSNLQIDIVGDGSEPVPFYVPTRAYYGAPTSLAVDAEGKPRSMLAPRMGAIETYEGCNRANVYCVCLGCPFMSIATAYAECAVNDFRDDCEIRISSDLSPLHESLTLTHSMNESTPGIITTFPGETVEIHSTNAFVMKFEAARHWFVMGGENGGRLRIRTFMPAASGVSLTNGAEGIQIGPNVDVFPGMLPSMPAIDCSGDSEGIVIEGVNFLSPDNFRWSRDIRVTLPTFTPPIDFDHRFIARGCRLSGGIYLNNVIQWIVESNYFEMRPDADALYLANTRDGFFQNNIVFYPFIEMWNAIVVSQSSFLVFLHNTFHLLDSLPRDCFMKFDGIYTFQDPSSFFLLNNLFVGDWANATRPLLCEVNCFDGDYCLDDPKSVLGCNRADANLAWGPLNWTDVSSFCDDSGVDVPIQIFSGGELPDPYYHLTVNYAGNGTGLVNFDYLGLPRNLPAPTMGALEFQAVCFGLSTRHPDACFGEGVCVDEDVCVCDDPLRYTGPNCNISVCYGQAATNLTGVCSDNGTCVGPSNCSCFNHSMYTGDECEIPVCDGIPKGDGSECNANGTCVAFDDCDCSDDLQYTGQFCELPVCNTIPAGPASCSRNGTCVGPGTCECRNRDEYTGRWCDVPVCNLIARGLDGACSDNGTCVAYDHCVCSDPMRYRGQWCEIPVCNGRVTGDPDVCNSHGSCEDPGLCDCHVDWGGSLCLDWRCDGILYTDQAQACSGNGDCIGVDNCSCTVGWGDTFCNVLTCNGILSGLPNVCNGQGECSAPNTCSCDDEDKYRGDYCEIPLCDSIPADDETVCRGHGDCQDFQSCVCEDGFTGVFCEESTGLGGNLTLFAAIGGGAGGVVLLVLGFIIIVVVVCCVCRRKPVVLGDELDVIRQSEVAAEVAKLEIDDSLFEINIAELKVSRSIGTGGSAATEAFKLHDFMTQQKFSEFEKEVRILSSLSHPNILVFYGACLNPPRVGIVMEYCPNGDVADYLISHEDTPRSVRFRILMETALACTYIHSKGIIHRDLKWENCLLDKHMVVKLMDFGLSRKVESFSMQKTTRIGTSFYMAPEICTGLGDYDFKVDSFSFGVMTFVILTGNFGTPFGRNSTQMGIEMRIANDPTLRPSFDDTDVSEADFPSKLIKLMRACWAHAPEERPVFEQIVDTLESIDLVDGADQKRREKTEVKKSPKPQKDDTSEDSETSSEEESKDSSEGAEVESSEEEGSSSFTTDDD